MISSSFTTTSPRTKRLVEAPGPGAECRFLGRWAICSESVAGSAGGRDTLRVLGLEGTDPTRNIEDAVAVDVALGSLDLCELQVCRLLIPPVLSDRALRIGRGCF